MDLGIKGRTAAVAAGSAGLGLASAAALAAEGARVAICGRDEERVRRAASTIGAIPIVCDVSTMEGGVEFVRAATDALGGTLDILVTNAGGPPPGTFGSTALDLYPGALQLNLLSVVGMCKEAVPAMQERKWGRVVAITSISVKQPLPNLILSNTARAGVTGFLKTLAREVASDGVTVNSVQPGIHATDRIKGLYADEQSVVSVIPAGVLGDPKDFGHVVAFLCSEHARFVTGEAVLVDGGQYAGLQ